MLNHSKSPSPRLNMANLHLLDIWYPLKNQTDAFQTNVMDRDAARVEDGQVKAPTDDKYHCSPSENITQTINLLFLSLFIFPL